MSTAGFNGYVKFDGIEFYRQADFCRYLSMTYSTLSTKSNDIWRKVNMLNTSDDDKEKFIKEELGVPGYGRPVSDVIFNTGKVVQLHYDNKDFYGNIELWDYLKVKYRGLDLTYERVKSIWNRCMKLKFSERESKLKEALRYYDLSKGSLSVSDYAETLPKKAKPKPKPVKASSYSVAQAFVIYDSNIVGTYSLYESYNLFELIDYYSFMEQVNKSYKDLGASKEFDSFLSKYIQDLQVVKVEEPLLILNEVEFYKSADLRNYLNQTYNISVSKQTIGYWLKSVYGLSNEEKVENLVKKMTKWSKAKDINFNKSNKEERTYLVDGCVFHSFSDIACYLLEKNGLSLTGSNIKKIAGYITQTVRRGKIPEDKLSQVLNEYMIKRIKKGDLE